MKFNGRFMHRGDARVKGGADDGWTESPATVTLAALELKRRSPLMTVLEKAVGNLAASLETLEAKLEDRLDQQSADRDAVVAARRQAKAARQHAAEANSGLAAAISDIKALLDANDLNQEG